MEKIGMTDKDEVEKNVLGFTVTKRDCSDIGVCRDMLEEQDKQIADLKAENEILEKSNTDLEEDNQRLMKSLDEWIAEYVFLHNKIEKAIESKEIIERVLDKVKSHEEDHVGLVMEESSMNKEDIADIIRHASAEAMDWFAEELKAELLSTEKDGRKAESVNSPSFTIVRPKSTKREMMRNEKP